jgi:CO/xanthine dehydrogenase Mo-binding subunit
VGPYRYEAVALQGRLAYTNNGIAGAFRGFGAVQVHYALEQQVDRLARLAGQDPAAFRALNLQSPTGPGPLGQVVAPFDGPQRALDVVASHPLWQGPRRWRDGRWARGVGLALVHRSDGFARGGPNAARLALALAADGKIELRAGFTELGQNLVGSLRSLAARHLGCAEDDVRPVLGDSALTPNSGPVAASRCTTLAYRAVVDHGPVWSARLLAAAAGVLDLAAAGLRLGAGGVCDADGRPRIGYPELAAALGPDALPEQVIDLVAEETPSDVEGAHYVFGSCAALAQVAVDTWTGAVRVERLVLAAALGPVASPQGLLGQMEGGALIGQGLATTEVLAMRDARYLARNLDGYLIPTLADAPAIEVIAIENVMEGDTVGPRGAGEIGVNIATPAIANGISAAIGMPVDRLPVAPDAILDYLESRA